MSESVHPMRERCDEKKNLSTMENLITEFHPPPDSRNSSPPFDAKEDPEKKFEDQTLSISLIKNEMNDQQHLTTTGYGRTRSRMQFARVPLHTSKCPLCSSPERCFNRSKGYYFPRKNRKLISGVHSWSYRTFMAFVVGIILSATPSIANHRYNNNRATLTIFDFTSWSYRAMIADFGISIHEDEGRVAYHATMMVPTANHSQLCEVPDSLTEEALSNSQSKQSLPFVNATEGNSNQFDELNLSDAPSELPIFSSEPASQSDLTSLQWQFRGSIALLVSLGGCDVMTKVKVAVELHQRITQDLKYIVFYNNDPNDPDNIATLSQSTITWVPHNSSTTIPWTEEEKQIMDENMMFVSVSTGTGASILGRIDRLAAGTGSSPVFADTSINRSDYRHWQLPMVLERVTDASQSGSLSDNGSGDRGRYDANYSFYWFRFILFALLIVSPCIRAAYLWWYGGGRIRLRRDPETGRIVGLQYTPPMQNWFGLAYYHHHHHDRQEHSPVHDRLTQEQVMALPEITFRLSSGNEADGDHKKASKQVEASHQNDGATVLETIELSKGSKSLNGNSNKIPCASMECNSEDPDRCEAPELSEEKQIRQGSPDLDSNEVSLPPPPEEKPMDPNSRRMIAHVLSATTTVAQGSDEEQPPESTGASTGESSSLYNTTICTTCSICIDEFVDGERVRLLPRCGHAFHTECILPWLSERQGCCPLCKMAVLGADPDSEDEDNDGSNNEGEIEVVQISDRTTTSESLNESELR
ncbi:ring finger domain containing protein [Nitzschia inconspicua]|uniref:Ring finger domain containing protein n=1 Tax=Nitzschia inconspicua TaxID=303405 RepID=A0A9K3K6V8_9STRA|nr:ring finger domain containing protein [Nitzschia inconspicua]KAG7348260.1 ring finger domain containing protein [Nitzschia inconspicua]